MKKNKKIILIGLFVLVGLLIITLTALTNSNTHKNQKIYAIMHTNEGNITILLFHDTAPQATQRFIKLAHNNFYNGTIIHRVFPGIAIYGGQYLMNSTLKPYPYELIPVETHSSVRHVPGVVSLLRSAQDETKIGCQFLICLTNITSLDGRNTILGMIVEGYDIVERISTYPIDDQYGDGSGRLLYPFDVYIDSIEIKYE